MIPGKSYTPEVVLDALWRRKWLILVPFVIIAVTTVVVTRRLPNRFRSETLIMVVPQQIPENYVQPTVKVRLEDRLASFNQQILSRTRLEQIVREFNLYPEERKTELMEDVIERMRMQDIGVQTTGPGERQGSAPTFRISYSGRDPRTVQKVTERLGSLFIDESQRDRSALAEGTNQFLESELQEARNRLIEQEKRLETYRQQHAGELPSQLNSNMQAIQNIQMQLQALAQSITQDKDRRQMVDRLIAEAEALPPIAGPMPGTAQPGPGRGGSLGAGGAAAGGCPCAASGSRDPVEADASRSRPHEACDRPPRGKGRSGSAPAAPLSGRRRAVVGEPTGAAAAGAASRSHRRTRRTATPDCRQGGAGGQAPRLAGVLPDTDRRDSSPRDRARRADARLRNAPPDLHGTADQERASQGVGQRRTSTDW